ncbi:MAG: phosphoribosyltransferase family protein [Patescibacteria group bacterium]
MEIEYLPLSWENYLMHIRDLADRLLHDKKNLDLIVAISRGGLTLGHVLSDHLRIPIWTIIIQSYTDIKTQGEIKITGKLQTSIKSKNILLVDDVADSGHTFVRGTHYLKRCKPKSITTLSVFYKPRSVFFPDYFAQTTDKWILFPYEATEMINLIITKLKKEKQSKEKIRRFLRRLKYSEGQIDFAVNHYFKDS